MCVFLCVCVRVCVCVCVCVCVGVCVGVGVCARTLARACVGAYVCGLKSTGSRAVNGWCHGRVEL